VGGPALEEFLVIKKRKKRKEKEKDFSAIQY
jgi:hypothetical protein